MKEHTSASININLKSHTKMVSDKHQGDKMKIVSVVHENIHEIQNAFAHANGRQKVSHVHYEYMFIVKLYNRIFQPTATYSILLH